MNRIRLDLGFTGSRHGMSDIQKAIFEGIIRDKCGTFHHGDCIGADSDAHDIVRKPEYRDNWKVIIHPPSNSEMRAYKLGDIIHPELPYYPRNKCIVRDTQVLIACPNKPEPKSLRKGGTWYTVGYARELIEHGLSKQCHIIMPNGDIGHVIFTPKSGGFKVPT